MRGCAVLLLAEICAVAPLRTFAGENANDPDAASPIEFLKQRVDENPTDPSMPTRLAVAYLDRAKRTADFTLYALAESACKESLKRDPKNVPAMLTLGSAQLAQHRFREAVASAEQALAVEAESSDALALRGDARLQLGSYADARADYEKVVAAKPADVVAHVRMAHLHFAEADADATLASFESAVRAGEESAASPTVMAWCLLRFGEFRFRTGEWNEAERIYAVAAELAPADDPDVLDHLAELHAARGEFEKALAFSQRAIDASPRPEFQHARGDIYVAMGKHEDAFACHQKALADYLRAAEAGHAHYYHHLATLWSDVESLRDPAEAVKWAKRDVLLRKTASTYDGLAWAFYQDGKYAEAAETVDKAFQRGNTIDAHVLYHAGLIYSRAINADKGRPFLRRAALANPKFNEFHFHR